MRLEGILMAKYLLYWRPRGDKLQEREFKNPAKLLQEFGALVADGSVVLVMAEVHKE